MKTLIVTSLISVILQAIFGQRKKIQPSSSGKSFTLRPKDSFSNESWLNGGLTGVTPLVGEKEKEVDVVGVVLLLDVLVLIKLGCRWIVERLFIDTTRSALVWP